MIHLLLGVFGAGPLIVAMTFPAFFKLLHLREQRNWSAHMSPRHVKGGLFDVPAEEGLASFAHALQSFFS